jgi:hypothetical protein
LKLGEQQPPELHPRSPGQIWPQEGSGPVLILLGLRSPGLVFTPSWGIGYRQPRAHGVRLTQ